jgi:hypothetical protein
MKTGEGSYIELPNIHEYQTPWLTIHSLQPTPMHAMVRFNPKLYKNKLRIIPAILPNIVR